MGHIEKQNAQNDKEEEFIHIEEDEVDHQQVAVEVNDDDQSEQKEQKDDIGDKQHFDEINHPFMVFLEKVLHKNPNTNKTLIQNAAQFCINVLFVFGFLCNTFSKNTING